MEKTKIKQEFTPWAASIHAGEDFLFRSSEIKRISVGLTTFNVLLGPYCLHDIGTSLSDALAKADNYIADNFEVEKPIEQRLKEAEAKIVTLENKVQELGSNPLIPAKFSVGASVRVVGDTNNFHYGIKPVLKRELRNGNWFYSRDEAPCHWKEDQLEVV